MNFFYLKVSFIFVTLISCQNSKNPIEKVIVEDPYLNEIANDDRFEVQVLYTQIDDQEDSLIFKTFSFRESSGEYFYPASTVKLPIALFAFEKLNKLKIDGLDEDSRMFTDSAFSGQTKVLYDSSSITSFPSVSNYTKKILVASDNDSYNRLYEFLGQDNIDISLKEKGYLSTRIVHRLSIPLSKEENRNTNPVWFLSNTQDTLHYQPALRSTDDYFAKSEIKKGIGYLEGDSIVYQSFDFTNKNFFPLVDQHKLLLSLFYREYFRESSFDLSNEQFEFITKYMSVYPRNSGMDIYSDSIEYYDSYVKFFIFGDQNDPIDSSIKIYNKIGMAYGYLIDNAYIVDEESGIRFFLSAVIHVNENQIYNDGIYEYEEIGLPFLAQLGRQVYNYELGRRN